MMKSRFVIAYDISDNRRRCIALGKLREWSISYQNSLFEIPATEAEIQQLCQEMLNIVEDNGDYLLSVRVCPGKYWQLGVAPVTWTGGLLLIS